MPKIDDLPHGRSTREDIALQLERNPPPLLKRNPMDITH